LSPLETSSAAREVGVKHISDDAAMPASKLRVRIRMFSSSEN